jgi:hypothetical protein
VRPEEIGGLAKVLRNWYRMTHDTVIYFLCLYVNFSKFLGVMAVRLFLVA